jgi:energy-coupling factor transport system permease protein
MFFSLNDLGLLSMTGLFAIMLMVAFWGRLPLDEMLLSLRKISLLLVIVGLVQGFRGNGFEIEAASEAIIRIVGVFLVAGFYLVVSPQSELMYFWEVIFRPLRLFRLPARELALVMVIAVRFLPVMLAEIDRIRMAQMARGAKLGKGGIFSAAAAMMPLMIPTLSQAIIRAEELAEAMEARGYRVSNCRTRYQQYKFRMVDVLAGITVVLLTAATICSRFC